MNNNYNGIKLCICYPCKQLLYCNNGGENNNNIMAVKDCINIQVKWMDSPINKLMVNGYNMFQLDGNNY